MTGAELRRLADQKLVVADSLSGDAGRLRSQAAALQGLLDPLVAMSQRVWSGPAATDFEATSRVRSQQVDEQAAVLVQIAGELHERAERLRREAAALRRDASVAETTGVGSGWGGLV